VAQHHSFLALVLFATGCGTCDAGVDDLGGSSAGGNGTGNGNTGGSTGEFIPEGGGPPGGCTTCSADLHQILD
jgi:hypothetical protein